MICIAITIIIAVGQEIAVMNGLGNLEIAEDMVVRARNYAVFS